MGSRVGSRIALICAVCVAASIIGCGDSGGIDPKDSIANDLKAAKINPNGPPSKSSKLPKAGENKPQGAPNSDAGGTTH